LFWVYQWNNLENRSIFCEVIDMSRHVSCFFWLTVHIAIVSSLSVIRYRITGRPIQCNLPVIRLSAVHVTKPNLRNDQSNALNVNEESRLPVRCAVRSKLFDHTAAALSVAHAARNESWKPTATYTSASLFRIQKCRSEQLTTESDIGERNQDTTKLVCTKTVYAHISQRRKTLFLKKLCWTVSPWRKRGPLRLLLVKFLGKIIIIHDLENCHHLIADHSAVQLASAHYTSMPYIHLEEWW